MDFVNFMRTVEQFAYELMAWALFYPVTIARVLARPGAMVAYVAEEDGKDAEAAYSAAMRPALFLLLSLSIGALLIPFTPDEAARLSVSRLGRLIAESWMALVLFRMCAFIAFPIIGALVYDIFTPGVVDRLSLRRPFSQQCYIFAPYALFVSPLLVLSGRGSLAALAGVLAATAWGLGAQFIFYRAQAGFGRINAAAAAIIVMLSGWIWMIVASLVAV